MDDATYDRVSEATLRQLLGAIDALGLDEVDATLAHGVLEVELDSGARLFVSRQPPLHQLWLATPDRALKLDHTGGRWVDRAGRELVAAIEQALGAALGRPVTLERLEVR